MADERTDSDKLLDWCTNLLEDGRNARTPYEAMWWENLATYNGDLWADFDTTLRRFVEPDKPDWRVRLPLNLARPALRTEYAKLLKNRPMIDCLARSNDQKDLNSAEVGDKLLYDYIEKNLHMPRYRRRMLMWALICGLGGMLVDYDDMAMGTTEVMLGPDGQPVTDQRLIAAVEKYWKDKKQAPKVMRMRQGQLKHTALSPWQFLWDRSKLEYDEAAWIIVSEVYDVDEIFVRWEVEVEGESDAVPGVMERRMVERWDLTQKLEWRGGDTQKIAEVHRMFIKPGHRYFPEGHEIVFVKDKIISHRDFPFKHGLLPVGIMGHVPMPTSQYSMSILQDLKPLVLELSKTASQLIENRNMMANLPWIEYRQNRIQGEIQNKPGLRLEIDWHPQVPDPHPVEMPDMPAYVQNLIPVLKETIQEAAGQSEVSQGKVPAGARAGVTIAYLQEEDDTKIAPTTMEYEEAMERIAWLDLQTIAEKYDTHQTIQIYKRHSEPEVFDFIGTMLEGVAGVVCQAGSALPRSKAAKQQFILDLWDRKLEQDPRKVREMLELSEGDPDEWEAAMDQAERENRKLMAGMRQPVLEWYNHPAHHYVHRKFMISADFENLPLAIKNVMLQHDEEHSAFEREQQAQQLVMAQTAGGGPGGAQQAPVGPPGQGQMGAPGGGNGVTATPQPPFANANGNGFAPPESGSTENPQSYAPQ